mgnify:CR=1 FL=1
MSYTWVKTFIEDLALQPNGRLRMDCPICQKKNTLSVSDDGYRRMYNCFSANCDVKGVLDNRLTPINARVVFEKKSEPSVKHKVSDFKEGIGYIILSWYLFTDLFNNLHILFREFLEMKQYLFFIESFNRL